MYAPKLPEDQALRRRSRATMFPKPDVPSRFSDSYWVQVGEWIHALAGGYLRATEGTAAFPADAAELADHIWSEIRISTNGFEVWAGRYGMSHEDLDQRVRDKAAYVLSTFQPAIPRGPFKGRFARPFTRDECARGGRAGTKQKHLQKRLDALLALPEGMSPEEQAEALECSLSSIWRYRRLLRERQAIEVDPDLQLLAAMDAEIAGAAPFPEMSAEGVSEEAEARITIMTIPDHVPASWTENVHDIIARDEAEKAAAVTADAFLDIEVEA